MKCLAPLISLVLFFSLQVSAQQEQPLPKPVEEQHVSPRTKAAAAAAKSPLYILKHKRASYELDSAQVKELDPNTIKSIEVIKGDGAVVGWGVRAEQGVVIIHVDRAGFRKFLEQESD